MLTKQYQVICTLTFVHVHVDHNNNYNCRYYYQGSVNHQTFAHSYKVGFTQLLSEQEDACTSITQEDIHVQHNAIPPNPHLPQNEHWGSFLIIIIVYPSNGV